MVSYIAFFRYLIILLSVALGFCGNVFAFTEDQKIDQKTINKIAKYGIYNYKCEGITDRLIVLKPHYYGFDGKVHNNGEIIVLDAAAEYVEKIFDELLEIKFPIYGISPIKGVIPKQTGSFVKPSINDNYNYTSSFCCRSMVDSDKMSIHSFGTAIDINPLQNPYIGIDVQNKEITHIIPKDGINYINRNQHRNNKPFRLGIINEDIENIFKKNGFTIWGGDWDYPIDYHHFQLSRNLTDLLIAMNSSDAEKFFGYHVKYYNKYNKEIVDEMILEMRVNKIDDVINVYKVSNENFWKAVSKVFNSEM